MEHPVEGGVRYLGPVTDPHGNVAKSRMPVDRMSSLGEAAADYAYFTPAVPYLYGGVTDAQLIDFMFDLGRDVPISYGLFRAPLFSGLAYGSDVRWNHALWAVPAADWPALHDFLVAVATYDPATRDVAKVGSRRMRIRDPLRVDAGTFDPSDASHMLEVTALGLAGNRFTLGLLEAGVGPPALVNLPPGADMEAFADAFFAGGNPLDARSDYRKGGGT